MITRDTVFVIGAGAHCPYEFPDGRKLMKLIIDALPRKLGEENNAFVREIRAAYPNIADIELFIDFRKMLDKGGHSSIDSFLATHADRNGFPEIGKFSVANILLPKEFHNKFTKSEPAEGDWLSHLFERMLQGCLKSAEDFVSKNRNVAFVTFNYDRTLEYFLCMRLEHTYKISREAAWQHVSNLQIVHVYGSLGKFDPSLIISQKKTFSSIEKKAAADCIRLMYDDRKHPEIEKAIEMISRAQLVCFLGFAFDPDNINRLKLNEICERKNVMATRYQMAEGDWQRACKFMKPSGFEGPADRLWDALMFLRESNALV